MIDFMPPLADILNEVIAGAIGGTVVAVVAFCVAFYKRKRFEAKFPIAGHYISFFEDIMDGNSVVIPSVSDIEQKGNSLRIITKADHNRSWTLNGTILPGGHVHGVYSADAVYDEGVGSFYLRISKDKLDGMWNGYDHENRITNGGRYWFRKTLSPDVRDASSDDLNSILHTSSNAFGHGYLSETLIENDEDNFALVCEIGDEFGGFCIGSRQPADSIRSIIRADFGVLPDDVRLANERGTLGLIRSIAVRRKFRGHGVGTQLILEAERRLSIMGSDCIIVPAWSREEKTYLGGILIKNDYSRWIDNDLYWNDDCLRQKFHCVHYDGACHCSVVFYRKGRI